MKISGLSVNNLKASSYTGTASNEDVSVARIAKLSPVEQQQDQQHVVNKLVDEEKQSELSKEEAEHIVNGLNEILQPKMTSLSFKLHDKLDRFYVEVIDKDSKEVIKEIPEKELLDIYAKMTDFLGLFIDEKL